MSALGGCVLVEDVSDLLGAVVGDCDTDMRLICHEGLTEAFLLTWGEPARARRAKDCGFGRGDHPLRPRCPRVSCWTRRRTSPGASPASLTMWKASRTLVASWSRPSDGVLTVSPWRGLESRSGYRSEAVRRALLASSHARCQTGLGPGPLKLAVG